MSVDTAVLVVSVYEGSLHFTLCARTQVSQEFRQLQRRVVLSEAARSGRQRTALDDADESANAAARRNVLLHESSNDADVSAVFWRELQRQ